MEEFLKDLQDVFNKHHKTLTPTKRGIVIKDCADEQFLGTNKYITASEPDYHLFIASQIVN